MKEQAATILSLLKTGRDVTNLEAIIDYGIGNLAARIHELRTLGYNIHTQVIKKTDHTGRKTHYGKYRLENEPD